MWLTLDNVVIALLLAQLVGVVADQYALHREHVAYNRLLEERSQK